MSSKSKAGRGGTVRLGPVTTFTTTSGRKKQLHLGLSSSTTIQKPPNNNSSSSISALSFLAAQSSTTVLSNDTPDPDVEDTQFPENSRTTKSQHDYLLEWRSKAQEYLDCLLDSESIGIVSKCRCGSGQPALYKCITCGLPSHLCHHCVLAQHRNDPFHRILKWNGNFFQGLTLSSVGITIPARHLDGTSCPRAKPRGIFTVVHLNGFHEIEIESCECAGSLSFDLQLFSLQLFPATVTSPRTVFTFDVLEQFRMLHLEGKVSAYTFEEALTRLTTENYIGAWPVKNRLREFQRVARQWSYLHTLRQSLINNQDSLVTRCPACPQPGVNIPPDWESRVPAKKHWIFRQYTLFDANFRLTHEDIGKRTYQEAGLWEGKAFFVEEGPYKTYLESVSANKQQKSDCANLRAVSNVDRTRFGRLDVTGVAGAVCRHDCAIPGSFVNLAKGERYVNSDYALSNLMKGMKGIKEIVISYDIACQFSKNFASRFAASSSLVLPSAKIHFLIPKFHLVGHRDACQYRYSFNYAPGVGRTDGEGIERFWSPHNHLSGSTSKMAPGFRLDTLNLHFRDWNMRKQFKMGSELHGRLREARKQFTVHSSHFIDLCCSLNPRLVEKWKRDEEAFTFESGKPNIYRPVEDELPSKQTVLTTLTTMENPRDQLGNIQIPEFDSQLVTWVNKGLELENEQFRVRTRRATIHLGSTDLERDILSRNREMLWEQILAWRSASPYDLEMDSTSPESDHAPPTHPEEEVLMLPSAMPSHSDVIQLKKIEIRLREGQANDNLKDIRACISQTFVLRRDKKNNSRGQYSNSRANTLLDRFKAQLDQATEQYRHNYQVMLKLGMSKDHNNYRKLEDADLRLREALNSKQLGRGYESPVSWIWHDSGTRKQCVDGNWLEEGKFTRVQFLDAKVNCDRWKEEVELLQSEIERTMEYFQFFARKWQCAAESGSDGKKAWSARMAAAYSHFAKDVEKYMGTWERSMWCRNPR